MSQDPSRGLEALTEQEVDVIASEPEKAVEMLKVSHVQGRGWRC